MIFDSPPVANTIKAAYRKYCSENPEDLDTLFLEIGSLKSQLEALNKTAFLQRGVDEKWTTIFRDPTFVHLRKLVSMLLSIFSSNAYGESIFLVVKNVKTDERNRMKIKLLSSLVAIKMNSEMDCPEAYNAFLSDPILLGKVKSSEKYSI